MALQHLLRKEFIQIRRNSFIPRLILFFPIMVMCVMPWVMNMEVKNVVVDVVDNDRSTASQRLVHEIAANSYFIFHGQQPTYAAALQDIEQSSADIVVVIPPQFGRSLRSAKRPKCSLRPNAATAPKVHWVRTICRKSSRPTRNLRPPPCATKPPHSPFQQAAEL